MGPWKWFGLGVVLVLVGVGVAVVGAETVGGGLALLGLFAMGASRLPGSGAGAVADGSD
jgi:hypothetical protein